MSPASFYGLGFVRNMLIFLPCLTTNKKLVFEANFAFPHIVLSLRKLKSFLSTPNGCGLRVQPKLIDQGVKGKYFILLPLCTMKKWLL